MSASDLFTAPSTKLQEPIRAELFSVDRLEQHAESLAAAQTVDATLRRGRPLTPRVMENGRVLLEAYRELTQAIQKEHMVTPAAEWLVDNFHIVDEQLREIREDLPAGFYRKLPKLSSGFLKDYPRVFGVAWAFVAHTDSNFDPEILRRFVAAYQRVQPLTIGELWAVAITIRIVLVENLRRLAERIVRSRAARHEADALADSLVEISGDVPAAIEGLLRKFDDQPLADAFAVQLLQRLRDLNPNVRPVLQWLDARLDAQHTDADEIVRGEHQQQAALNVTVRNIITSMRLMSTLDWREFFESVSIVDEILREDTNFTEIDFASRDAYRHAIEDLSRGSRHSEVEIARRLVQEVRRARVEAQVDGSLRLEREMDPGYYLISRGREKFERELGFRLPWSRRLLRLYMGTATPGYLGTIAALTVAILSLPLLHDREAGVSLPGLVLMAILAAIPASDLAIALINRVVTDWLEPRTLPRLALRDGVPAELRTLVAIPTLLTSASEIEELVGRIEIHYLSNPEGYLHFALLSDWVDAPSESLSSDQELLTLAANGIARLNSRYGAVPGNGERFLLFHRKRVWNEGSGKWMGWERKRGKLYELNRLLRGATDTTFLELGPGVEEWGKSVRFVITLDADTRLPRGAAYELVGMMAHPLNRPEFSEKAARVVEGYGIIQPRVTPTLPSDHERSLYQKIFAGPSGIDSYSAAVSDVYQDLFREGSYTGKGIYDIDAFEAALANKAPENSLLSHDLFEGIFARTALATDVELFEEFPVHYETAAARQHRWARGDWQLLPWIFGKGPKNWQSGRPLSIPAIGRWKMMDNLRRSLSPPTAFLTLLAGWLLAPASPWVWARFILATIAIPALLGFFIGLDPRVGGISKRSRLRALLNDLLTGASQIWLNVTFLAYQAWLMADAIVRTLVRLFITRKNLLEWVTAAQAKYAVDFNLANMFRRMPGGLILAAVAMIAVAIGRPASLGAAVPFLLLWFSAPAVAKWISTPPQPQKEEPLPSGELRELRLTARRTWRYFETFVSALDHWLPPDNFQEDPAPVVAHRTSPTNIGVYLLSTLSAQDLGWIGKAECVERLDATLTTIDSLDRFRGHPYNWYDTSTLHPQDPKYVSSVDSGNLAGDLLAVSNAFREFLGQSLDATRFLAGLEDSLDLLREALANLEDTKRTHIVTRKHLEVAVSAFGDMLGPLPIHPVLLAGRLLEIRGRAHTLADIARTLGQERADSPDSELHVWADAVSDSVESKLRDARILIPWVQLDPKDLPVISKLFGHKRDEDRASEWNRLELLLSKVPALSDAPDRFAAALGLLANIREQLEDAAAADAETVAALDKLSGALKHSSAEAAAFIGQCHAAAQLAQRLFQAMDFTFLFDKTRKLLSIGYRVNEGVLDAACYDLLASEARLAGYVAIAKGDIPSSHWFHLGRALTPVDRGSALISWSGSMFEYLMPSLVMRVPSGSLLSETAELIVRRQIQYGVERGVPWGVSESAYNARDTDFRYQYSAFGVPGLGLKRGLSEDIVIAPYATGLAAMVDPSAAARNFDRIKREGGRGAFGFYESLDYTSSRVPEGEKVAIVRAYFAHHQGMALVALSNVLTDGAMRSRFHAEAIVKATELLLQERTPRDVLVARPRAEEVSAAAHVRDLVSPALRRFTTPHESTPRTQLLSNGRYALMLTSAGSGYSRWRDIAVTRWREDATRDCWGSFIYLRDTQTNQVWSAGYQPSGVEPDTYEVSFFEDRAEIARRDRTLTTALEVVVSSEDDAEMRRVSITNHGTRTREIQVTSYSEICLTSQAADAAHPAFSNLFVQTEFVPEVGAVLATRRKQSEQDPAVWLAHVSAVDEEKPGEIEYETDRMQFLGRGREPARPVAVFDGAPLRKTKGSVLDPIVSLRRTIRVPAGTTVRIVFSTLVAPSRQEAIDLADKHRDARTFERTLTLAWTQAQVQLHHLGIGPDEAHLFQRLANAVIFSDPALRPSSDVLSRTTIDRDSLWSLGISGDLPIVAVLIGDEDEIDIVRQVLRAHEYWRMKRLAVDVVLINEKPPSYEQGLQNSLEGLLRRTKMRVSPEANDSLGNVYLLRGDLMPAQTRATVESVARAVLLSRRGSLSDQVMRSQRRDLIAPPASRPRLPEKNPDTKLAAVQADLEFFNGLGGFAAKGREYVTVLSDGVRTPLPWSNVIANPDFGFLVTESGSGFTWAANSHENQLTPWSNDPVTDRPGEAIYVRDESTGEFWTPTALPIREESGVYVTRHGQGYTRFEHASHGMLHELTQFVPVKDPLKISRLVLQNNSSRVRRISVTAYAEWVLGSSRDASAPNIVTERDPQTGGLFARNVRSGEFGGRISFADLGGRQTSWTADRKEFLGRNGAPDSPAALRVEGRLSGKLGAGLDPCAALQTVVELRPGARVEIVFVLGQAENAERARELLTRYRAANLDEAFREVTQFWDEVLGTVQVTTPEPAMDMLLNRWLLYQTLSCRFWARTAFYQASGAYGFRDQLQDCMALSVVKRDITRQHLLRAAGRQFAEGDVQHWWHPPSGRGVRTRISDDLLWLPYAVSQFVVTTGDMSVLDESIPFLEGDLLAEGQKVSYFQPRVSESKATIFEHCARALDRSLAVGSHGLPLMGTGDWNDGMDRVGEQGKGESVWLAWFLLTVLTEFARIANTRGEQKRAENWRLHVSALKAAIEREAWDGDWYRRAYFDDGTPLGSATNDECRIDSIAQSWGIISGAAEPGRATRAMAALEQWLVRPKDALVLLLTPPFDHSAMNPGYIKDYVPGIRENGGQYTHAAAWASLAFAKLGNGDKAVDLFRMLNPINHGTTRASVQRYKVEPYVVAGDVYSEPPHTGRGGWTWYTGSAGWLYRVGMEALIGFEFRGMTLHIDPCIPRHWTGFSVNFRYHSAVYNIRVENPSRVTRGVALIKFGGKLLHGDTPINLVDDAAEHNILVVLG